LAKEKVGSGGSGFHPPSPKKPFISMGTLSKVLGLGIPGFAVSYILYEVYK